MLISELAENMIRLAGLSIRNEATPHGGVEVVVVGKPPGKKMYEELFYDSASAQRSRHAEIMQAASKQRDLDIENSIAEINAAIEDHDEQRARHILFDFVQKNFLEESSSAKHMPVLIQSIGFNCCRSPRSRVNISHTALTTGP